MTNDRCKECGGELMNFSCQCALVNKTMNEDDLEKAWSDYSMDIEFLGDADLEAGNNHIMTKPNFIYCLTESRKNMFTEKDMRDAYFAGINSLDQYQSGSDETITFEQYLTERKGATPKRKCTDCGTVFGGNERCPECYPMG